MTHVPLPLYTKELFGTPRGRFALFYSEPERTYRLDDSQGAFDEQVAKFIVHAANCHDELLAALTGLFEHCSMVHKHWGEDCNQRESDAAIAAARTAIAKGRAPGVVQQQEPAR